MVYKRIFTIILTMILLLAGSTIALASNWGEPAGQTGMDMPTETLIPTDSASALETAVPEVTPIVETPMPGTMNGGTMGGCPMMSGSGSMTGMSGMNGMSGMSGMQGMSGMNGMSGMTNMNGMTGMSGYGSMGEVDLYSTLSNPWYLLGWVLLGLVVVLILAGFTFGVLWIVRRPKA